MSIEFEKSSLRDVIGEYLVTLAERDERVVAVSADMVSTCRLKKFVERFPKRHFSVGISEQNMISFAAGLAHEGFMPYVFTMAPFMSMRACEQIRTDVAYENLNVRFHAPYAGVSGGISGVTHWGMEDCAIMNAIPNMTVFEPSDATQARRMLDYSLLHTGPIYIRSSVEQVKDYYKDNYKYQFGKSSIAVDGDDGAIVCSGVCVQFAVEAADNIKSSTGKNVRVVDMHTIKPIDSTAVVDAAKTGHLIVAQDHNVVGGLGQIVASIIAEEGLATKIKILGIPDKFSPMAHASYLYNKFDYDTEGIEKNMIELLRQ